MSQSQRYYNFEFEQSYTRIPPGTNTATGAAAGASGIGSLLGDPPPVRRQPQQQQQIYDPFEDDEMESTDSRFRGSDTYVQSHGSSNVYANETRSRERGPNPDRGSYSYSSTGTGTGSRLVTSSYGPGSRVTISQMPGPGRQNDKQIPSLLDQAHDQQREFHNKDRVFRGNDRGLASQAGNWRNRSPSPGVSRRQSEYGRRSPSWQEPLSRRQPEQVPIFNPSIASQQSFQQMGMGGPIQLLLPQGATGASSLMGVLPMGSQNQFQAQAPVQLILGNLPAFNSSLFEKQQMMSNQYGAFVRGDPGHGRDDYRSHNSRRDADRRRGDFRQRDNSPVRRTVDSISRRNSERHGTGGRKREASDRHPSAERKVARANSGDRVARGTTATTAGSPNKNNRGRSRRSNRNRKSAGGKADKADADSKEHGTEKDTKETEKATGNDKKTDVTDEGVEGKDRASASGEVSNVEQTGSSAKAKDTNDVEVVDMESEKEKKKSKYDEFPPSLLVCKVCQKGMKDGISFENHLNGRAHYALLKIVEEKFQRRTDLLMFESKSQEDEIVIEKERLKRAGQFGDRTKGRGAPCNMCNCTYSLNWGNHKSSYCHRVLKDFLHPTCRICDSNFVHRMDWVNHLFSIPHLRNVSKAKLDGKDVSEFEKLWQDELFAINIEFSIDDRATSLVIVRPLDWSGPTTKQLKEMLQNGKLDLPDGEIQFPEAYNESVAVGQEAIFTTEGKSCKLCRLYIGKDDKDALTHCSGRTHYENYVEYLKNCVALKEKMLKQDAQNDEENESVETKDKRMDIGQGEILAQQLEVIKNEPESGIDENEDDSAVVDKDPIPQTKTLKESGEDNVVEQKIKEENLNQEVIEPAENEANATDQHDLKMEGEVENEEEAEDILLQDEEDTNANEFNTETEEQSEEVGMAASDQVESMEVESGGDEETSDSVQEEANGAVDSTTEDPLPSEDKKIDQQPAEKVAEAPKLNVGVRGRGTATAVRSRSRGPGRSVIVRGALPMVSTRRAPTAPSAPIPAPTPRASLARGRGGTAPGRRPQVGIRGRPRFC